MKKLIIAVFALAVAFVTGPAFAGKEENPKQTNPQLDSPAPSPNKPTTPTTWFKVPILVDCAPLEKIVEMAGGQYGEQPFVTGSQFVQWFNGQTSPAGMTLTANADTGTWTLTANFADGIGCVLGSGGNLTPFVDAEKTKIKY